MSESKKPKHGVDYYIENDMVVFTEKFHLARGRCCGSKCRHCPYDPKHKKGATKKKDFLNNEE